MAEHTTHFHTKTHTVYLVIIVILVLALIAEFLYFHHRQEEARAMAGGSMTMGRMPGGRPTGMRMGMTAQKAPAESDQQKQQVAAGTDTSSTQKTFNITGGNFYFVPNKITVNKGDQVTFVMTNAGGFHDIKIDELGVKAPVVTTGNVDTVTFTASKTGSFIYYCDVMGHKAKGMWGTLVVQ